MFQSWLDTERAEVAALDIMPSLGPAGGTHTMHVPPPSVGSAAGGRPMRVLHAIHSLSGGGAETQLRLLVNSWPYPDVEVGVFFVAGDPAEITNPAVRLFPSGRSSTKAPGFILSVLQAMRDFDPDVAQIWLPESIAIPTMVFGRLQGRKVILSYRGRRSLVRWLTWFEVLLSTVCVDQIVSNHEVLTAPSYTGSIFRWLFARKRGQVIRNGVAAHPDLLQSASEPDGSLVRNGIPQPPGSRPFQLICVGRLNHLKNYPRLIEALVLLRDRMDWQLNIWGEGEERAAIEAAISYAGLTDRVHLRGYSPEVRREIATASALVLPSISEGMPNVLVEAMALGVPVIASDIEGIREVVGDQQACIWINPMDSTDIARGLAAFMDGQFEVGEFARRGKRIAGRYSVPAAQTAWRDVYRQLVGAA